MNRKKHTKNIPNPTLLSEKIEISEQKNEVALPSETPVMTKKKSILKPLFFFAVFALCIEAAVLYPLMTKKPKPLLNIPPKAPALVLDDGNAVLPPTEEMVIGNCVCDVCEKCPEVQCVDSQQADQLKARIHELEIENLSLKEQNSISEQTMPWVLELLTHIYTGQSFDKQLNQLIKYDKTNKVALRIQQHLGEYAKTGIPDEKKIDRLFTGHFQAAVDSFYQQNQSGSVTSYVKSFVHVYPEHLTQDNADGIGWLYLARQQVQNHDYEAAMQSIEHLPKHTEQLFNNFVAAVNIRQKAYKIITSIMTRKEIK